MVSDDGDDAIDDLYAADLDDFVARRDQLAKARRASGDRDAAASVKQLRKPSRAAWAVNQAVRRAPDKLDAVLDAGAALRDVQQRALREGAGAGLHDAVRARQRAVAALADVGVAALGPTGESARDAIEQTLQAASIDDEAAAAVRAARLVQELEPPDIFATLQPGPARPAPRPAAPAKPARREKAPAAPKERTPSAAERRALEQAEAAEAEAATARREADAAQRELESAKARADELTDAARDAAAAADDARAEARDAGARARDARKAAERAEQAARRARAAAGAD